MVKVYYETTITAKLVATFDEATIYNGCLPTLEKLAKEIGMFVTESIEDETRLKELVK